MESTSQRAQLAGDHLPRSEGQLHDLWMHHRTVYPAPAHFPPIYDLGELERAFKEGFRLAERRFIG